MLKIHHAGMHTSVQDAGRSGFRQLGVSLCGALDLPALRTANLLVGNDQFAAGLEVTLGNFVVEFTTPGWIALTGAGCEATLAGKSLWTGWSFPVKPGEQLRLHQPRRGMRSYLAVSGGIVVPEVMGSRSTDLKGGFGGVDGRLVRDGDNLPVGEPERIVTRSRGVKQLLWHNRVRALPGPEYTDFTPSARQDFWRNGWQLSAQSNRMGYRLVGNSLERESNQELLSHGLIPGVVQVPPNGQPIVLMADAQTTGGYPRIACVIEADRYHLAQLRLGEPLHFMQCTHEEAHQAWVEQERYFEQLARYLIQDTY